LRAVARRDLDAALREIALQHFRRAGWVNYLGLMVAHSSAETNADSTNAAIKSAVAEVLVICPICVAAELGLRG
jgi:hypothetical protein